jgi:hypothetical protein
MTVGAAHGARTARLLVAVALAAAAVTPSANAERRAPRIGEARAAARTAVLAHPTYRSIQSKSRLVTESCRRSGRAVRCRLYRWAPDPCALDGNPGPCAQVLTRRIWHVEVSFSNGRARARIARIKDTSSSPAQSESARSSS